MSFTYLWAGVYGNEAIGPAVRYNDHYINIEGEDNLDLERAWSSRWKVIQQNWISSMCIVYNILDVPIHNIVTHLKMD